MAQKKEFELAIEQIAAEKNIPVEKIVETIEAALAAAYRKDFGEPTQNIKVKFSVQDGSSQVFDVKTVVESIPEDPDEQKEKELNPREHVALADAKKKKKSAKVGDVIETKLDPPAAYGRIAAQTAKQVIIQRLREAEREIVSREFKGKEGEIINGSVQRIEGRNVYVDLAQATGVLYPHEQIPGETYTVGMRLKVYVAEVRDTSRGPEIILSRSHPQFVAKLFELEVPEIYSGVVLIKGIAREAGSRTKIAVATEQEGVDPVGSAVGQRGTRVQTVIAELGGEKIDIIQFDEDQDQYLRHAMSPAKVLKVELNEKEKRAKVVVDEDQLSLAIGKGGQNVRLAAKLTGWKIDVVSPESEGTKKDGEPIKDGAKPEEKKDEAKTDDKKAEGESKADEKKPEAEKPDEVKPEEKKAEEKAVQPEKKEEPKAEEKKEETK
ncbi:MAG: transcription termination factor NusA [Candidatus Andersenbacteria bacterium]